MPLPSPSEQYRERLLLTAFLAVLLFASPLALLWIGWSRIWLFPYLLWLAVIVPAALIHWRYRGSEEP